MTRKKYPHITPDLWPLARPLSDFQRHPRNARQGDLGAIMESLKRFGQQKPIVAQANENGTDIIVAGNHLHWAAEELGWEHLAGVSSPMDDKTALAFMVADNRTQELGTYDDHALADLLSSLAMDGNLEATGYDGDDVDDLLKAVGAAPDLDGLADKYGEDAGIPDDFWPRIIVKVPPPLFHRWTKMFMPLGTTDPERLKALLDKVR